MKIDKVLNKVQSCSAIFFVIQDEKGEDIVHIKVHSDLTINTFGDKDLEYEILQMRDIAFIVPLKNNKI